MGKRSDKAETVKVALELLKRIPRGRKVTASELHQQINDAGMVRSLRNIQMHLDWISEAFEIDRDERSKPFGYSWLERSSGMTLLNLTPQESLLLQLAESHLKNLLPARLMRSMEGFFKEARRNLGPESNARLEREWPSKVRVVATSQPLLPPKIASGVFEAVSEALFGNHWLHVEYRNASNHRSDAKVMPLGLVQQGPNLYLVCRYQGFANERNLALHRMLSARVSSDAFERPKNFDLKQYDEDGRFGFGAGEKIELIFCITKDYGKHLFETPLSADQQIKELKNGKLEVTATVVDSDMLDWWLRGFGPEVTRIRKYELE